MAKRDLPATRRSDTVPSHRRSTPSPLSTPKLDHRSKLTRARYRRSCKETYAVTQRPGGRAHGKLSFCVLRDPVARAVSSYNMAANLARRCDQAKLDNWLKDYAERGHADNHDVPQSDYLPYCSVRLCFDRLEQDFAKLVRAWAFDLIGQGNCSRAADASVCRTLEQLPPLGSHMTAKPGFQSCSTSSVPPETAELLRRKYARDVAAHEEACRSPSASRPPDVKALPLLKNAVLLVGERGAPAIRLGTQ